MCPQLLVLMNMIFYKDPEYNGVAYPVGVQILGWLIAMFPISVIVFWFLYDFCYRQGGFGVSGL